MPSYIVTCEEGRLTGSQKSQIAEAVTRAHGDLTGAPYYFVRCDRRGRDCSIFGGRPQRTAGRFDHKYCTSRPMHCPGDGLYTNSIRMRTVRADAAACTPLMISIRGSAETATMARLTKAQLMAGLRERRRRGLAVAKVRLDLVERRKLIGLGYLERSLLGAEKGLAIDTAVEAYLSDRLAEERVG